MTLATVLDKLPCWRPKLPPRYSPEFIDGFTPSHPSTERAL